MKTTTQEMSTDGTDNDTSAIIDSNFTGTDVKLNLCLSDMQPMQRVATKHVALPGKLFT